MKFSEFLEKIYDNRNKQISRQDYFVRDLFDSTGNQVFYTDDYYKKLFNGSKQLTKETRKLLSQSFDIESVSGYLYSVISDKRINDIFDDFSISDEEERNIVILCDALAEQFKNYISYGETADTNDIGTIYYRILDERGNGKIEYANEKALCFAKNYYYQSLLALSKIGPFKKSLLEFQAPFENFFDSIFKIFKIYNLKCTHLGHQLLKQALESTLDGSYPDVDKYLSKITEPGAEPIQLTKEILFIVYDNYRFEDKIIQTTITIDDNSEDEKILSEFKKLKFYPVNEIFFSEYISFREEDKDLNLLPYVDCIQRKIGLVLKTVQGKLASDYAELSNYEQKVNEARKHYQMIKKLYVTDGTYFPNEQKIKYSNTLDWFMDANDEVIQSGQHKFQMKKDFKFSKYDSLGFKKLVFETSEYQTFMWQHAGHFGDPMAELFTFNRDGSFRWFIVPLTCKARIYRLMRDVAALALKDDAEAFIFCSLAVDYVYKNDDELEKLLNIKTDNRLLLGNDIFTTYGYRNHHEYTFAKSQDDALNNLPSHEVDLKYPTVFPLKVAIDLLNDKHLKRNK